MSIKIENFTINSKGFDDLIDITSKVQGIVLGSGIKEGVVTIYPISSTASILMMDNEPGISDDFKKLIDNLIPINKLYQHDEMWHIGNAHAHLRAALLGKNVSLPILDSRIVLDSNQRVILADFNNCVGSIQIFVSITY